MPKSRTYRAQGVVLKQTPIGEADRILTLYTRQMGKIRVVARGIRRTKSRLAGHLEPLTYARVSIAEGRSLNSITEAETLQNFSALRENLGHVSSAIYISDLVDSFSEDGSPNAPVFELLLKTLVEFQGTEKPMNLTRYFEVQLLKHSGFGPEFYHCIMCFSVLEPNDHVFSSAMGGIACPDCRTVSTGVLSPMSLSAVKVLRFFQRESLEKATALDVRAPLLAEVERVLRYYLRYVLDRTLKSADFVKQVALTERG